MQSTGISEGDRRQRNRSSVGWNAAGEEVYKTRHGSSSDVGSVSTSTTSGTTSNRSSRRQSPYPKTQKRAQPINPALPVRSRMPPPAPTSAPSSVKPRRTFKEIDPNCAICNAPPPVPCDCESNALEVAVRQAENRILNPLYINIRSVLPRNSAKWSCSSNKQIGCGCGVVLKTASWTILTNSLRGEERLTR